MSDRILVGRWFETKWQDNRSTRETAMMIRVFWIALVALLAGSFGVACGGSSGGGAGTGDTGAKGGSIAAAGNGAVVCAKETCKLPDGVTGELCCMDPFAGGCGIKAGQTCRAFPSAADARCPAVSFGGFMMPGASAGSGGAGGSSTGSGISPCCATNGECGFSIGIGTGCMAISATCNLLPRQIITMLTAQKCDGTPVELPADCGSTTMLPGGFGGGGRGAGTAGSTGTGTAGTAAAAGAAGH
jgi:hypothetical protein